MPRTELNGLFVNATTQVNWTERIVRQRDDADELNWTNFLFNHFEYIFHDFRLSTFHDLHFLALLNPCFHKQVVYFPYSSLAFLGVRWYF